MLLKLQRSCGYFRKLPSSKRITRRSKPLHPGIRPSFVDHAGHANSATLGDLPAELPAGSRLDPWLSWQAQHLLSDDVALDLIGARVDGSGPGAQEVVQPGCRIVARRGRRGEWHIGDDAVVCNRMRPEHLDGGERDVLVQLGPGDLAHRCCPDRNLVGEQGSHCLKTAISQRFDSAVEPSKLLAYERIGQTVLLSG
jgi:hypothetical protein